MITHAELLELISYDPATGVFTWRKSRPGAKAGAVAGCVQKGAGYVTIRVKRHKPGNTLKYLP